jgi:hypothetical protein
MIKGAARSVAASLRAIIRAIPAMIVDLAGIAGAGSIAYGAWLIYVPAGYIVGGLILVAGAYRLGVRAIRSP